MPLTNADNPTAEPAPEKAAKAKPVEKPVLLGTGNSSNPDVQHLASKRAHLVGAVDSATAEIAAIDEQLAALGYKA